MPTYYAWAEIRYTEVDDSGKAGSTVVVNRGDKVEKSKFKGISEATWDSWVAGGSIREKPFPAPEGYLGSALDYMREEWEQAQSGTTVEAEEAAGALAEVQEEAAKLESKAK